MLDRIWALFSGNLGTKVISVIIAMVLWVVVLGSRNVEVTKDIPLEVITPGDMVSGNEIPEKISFRLSGPKAFLRAILDRREEPIRVNLAGSKPGLVTYRFFSDNIRVPIGVKVMSINPTAILIKLENVKHRDVPVRVELRGIPPEGYRLVKTEVRPNVIRIKGAESRIESVTEVSTQPIEVSTLTQPLEREVPLDLSRLGVLIDGPLPRVLVDVEPTSANYRIRNVEVRVQTQLKYTVVEKTVTVNVRALPKDLKNLDTRHVYAVVDLRGKPKGHYPAQPLKVILPENLGLVRATPDKVDVTLH